MLSLVPIRGTRESVLILFLLVIFGGFNMSETRIVIPVKSVRYYFIVIVWYSCRDIRCNTIYSSLYLILIY